MYALIGCGGNDLEIPLMIHNTWQEAFDYLVKYLGIDKKYKLVSYQLQFDTDSPSYTVAQAFAPNRYAEMDQTVKNLIETGKSSVSVEEKEYLVDKDLTIDYDFNSVDSSDETSNEIFNAFFSKGRYYGGCGGCYGIALRKIQPGQPIVHWDLD